MPKGNVLLALTKRTRDAQSGQHVEPHYQLSHPFEIRVIGRTCSSVHEVYGGSGESPELGALMQADTLNIAVCIAMAAVLETRSHAVGVYVASVCGQRAVGGAFHPHLSLSNIDCSCRPKLRNVWEDIHLCD
jgi:hypothetical protein